MCPPMSIVLLLLLLVQSQSGLGHPAPDDTEFIRSSCSGTLYPDVCFRSLSGYSSAVQQDPAQLAKVAIAVTLSKAREMAAFVSREAEYGTDARAASAVHDCYSNMGDAVEEIRASLKQMKQVGASGGTSSSVMFQISNVQTWMSAALTDEETCTDGFQDIPDGPVKEDVFTRISDVKKFTSNALALVNLYAHKVSPPSPINHF